MMMIERILQFARILLRFALGVTFLVSVADRFGTGPERGQKCFLARLEALCAICCSSQLVCSKKR
jgi:hypothetical protein